MLWFEDSARQVVVVCTICSHDAVSRKLEWMEACLRNTAVTSSSAGEMASALINVDTHTPMKVFSIRRGHRITFELKLSASQEEIVQTRGGVCMLGRSGKGKTETVVKRMVNDCRNHGVNPQKQLFVAHTRCLIDNAKRMCSRELDHIDQPKFLCFMDVLRDVENHFGVHRTPPL